MNHVTTDCLLWNTLYVRKQRPLSPERLSSISSHPSSLLPSLSTPPTQSGGFYSAEDADSVPASGGPEKREGAFCVWTASEVRELLPDVVEGATGAATQADIFAHHYGVKEQGNVAPEQVGRNGAASRHVGPLQLLVGLQRTLMSCPLHHNLIRWLPGPPRGAAGPERADRALLGGADGRSLRPQRGKSRGAPGRGPGPDGQSQGGSATPTSGHQDVGLLER